MQFGELSSQDIPLATRIVNRGITQRIQDEKSLFSDSLLLFALVYIAHARFVFQA